MDEELKSFVDGGRIIPLVDDLLLPEPDDETEDEDA